MGTRYIIEGTWSGYRSWQERLVHKDVTTDKKLADAVAKAHSIVYTDGTCLVLRVRTAKKGERVTDLRKSYTSLIRDCARAGVWSVAELQKARKEVQPA